MKASEIYLYRTFVQKYGSVYKLQQAVLKLCLDTSLGKVKNQGLSGVHATADVLLYI